MKTGTIRCRLRAGNGNAGPNGTHWRKLWHRTPEGRRSATPIAARHARRAVIASTVGTMIEWYDFYLYGLAAALVFGKLFFPSQDPYAATLLAFSTSFLGFAARPLGAIIFGHFGDRIGRRGTLVATLLLMGVSTVLIGLVPTS